MSAGVRPIHVDAAPAPASARLRFRCYTESDEGSVVDLFSDPDARLFYPEMGDPSRAQRWIAWNLENYRTYGFGLWALELKNSATFVGDCGLTWQDVEGTRELEIGYHVAARFRRQGYATEAAQATLEFALRRTDAPMICSIVRPSNEASCAVARRVHEASREFTKNRRPALLFYTFRRPDPR